MKKYGLLLLAALLLGTSPVSAEGPFGPFSVGAWSAGAYTDPSGKFSHCAALASYNSGIAVVVGVDSSYGWSLGFLHEAWNLAQGETIPIDLTFDNRSTFRVFGVATKLGSDNRARFVKVPMPDDSQLIAEFRRAFQMQAFAKGHLYAFNLTSTSRLLPALATCVGRYQPTTTTAAPAGPNSNGVQIASRADTLEVATVYLGKSPVTYRILPQEENLMKNMPVNWKYGQKSIGGMMVIYGDNLDGKKALATLLQDQAGSCLEKNATDVKPPERSGEGMIYRADGLCQMDGETASTSYMVAETRSAVVVIMEMVDETDARTNPEMKEERELSGELLASFPARRN